MTAPSYISAHEIYRLGELKRRLGLGRWSFRKLRQAGLPVIVIGRNSYIEGSAAIETIKRLAEQQAGGNGEGGGND
jgi:hypothetical protein